MRRAALVVCGLALLSGTGDRISFAASDRSFASDVARLSEPGGFFDTDNLISNESSYTTVVPAIVSSGVAGGAYLGVGPDQNFTYIARVRPAVAFIIDIRRDNLLLHLLFKALFAAARNRAEYLSLLTGRAPPADVERWDNQSLEKIIDYVSRPPQPESAIRLLRKKLDRTIAQFGLPLSAADEASIERFHRAFIEAGLDLRFHTFGRQPQFYYPNLRELLLATDAQDHAWSYLASERDYQYVRQLEADDKIIPIVGNLGGTQAMAAVAGELATRGLIVSAFYVSNVEHYLSGDAYWQFIDNLKRLPRDRQSVLIRSVFTRGASVSSLDRIDHVLAETASGQRVYR